MMDPLQPKAWKSVRPGKISWTENDCERLCDKWLAEMPDRALDLVRSNQLPAGAKLVAVESEVTKPSVKEISKNFLWLRAVCEENPDKVPSAFYLADCFIMLDGTLRGSLLVPSADETKADMAGKEAKRLKRLIDALRHLFRNSPEESIDPHVAELKSLLKKSPSRGSIRDEEHHDADGEMDPNAPLHALHDHDDDEGERSDGDNHHDGRLALPDNHDDDEDNRPSPSSEDSDSSHDDSNMSDQGDADQVDANAESAPGPASNAPGEGGELTPQEKRKRFWSQFVVKKDFHNPMTSSADPTTCAPMGNLPSDSSDGEMSITTTESLGSAWSGSRKARERMGVTCGRHTQHNVPMVDERGVIETPGSSSETDESGTTLVLGQPRKPKTESNPKAEPYQPSDDSDDGSSDTSMSSKLSKGVVSEHAFMDEMEKASISAQNVAINSGPSSSSKATMETPKSDRPNFWGFPLVGTPPKVDAPPRANKIKTKTAKKGNKASFRRSGGCAKSRKPVREPEPDVDAASLGHMSPSPSPEPLSKYGEYSLDGVPMEAWPCKRRANRGHHSYTLSDCGAVVEVLLQKRAFFIKKIKPGFPGPIGQLSWGKYGSAEKAWQTTKARSGFHMQP